MESAFPKSLRHFSLLIAHILIDFIILWSKVILSNGFQNSKNKDENWSIELKSYLLQCFYTTLNKLQMTVVKRKIWFVNTNTCTWKQIRRNWRTIHKNVLQLLQNWKNRFQMHKEDLFCYLAYTIYIYAVIRCATYFMICLCIFLWTITLQFFYSEWQVLNFKAQFIFVSGHPQ